jgi:hypothetical protein
MKPCARHSLGGLLLAALVLTLSAGACRSATSPERKLPAREPFIALERDFQGFEGWQRIELGDRPPHGETHAGGEAVEYANQLAPAGATVFPVGTILVKSVTKEAQKRDVFAMVKRGGGYNANGSPGWEWFELKGREDGSYGIKWRGINPPNNEGYSGDAAGGCNGCHQMAIKNDYVLAKGLNLSKT